MAGSSASQSTSQSYSDTYIPEYSESPFLRATAEQARAMSDQVYSWGMDQFNRGQGDIDGLMRDALSYASPQRIAVDMGMAEAGVQQAGERGRLSAVRDLESYGVDPSSGRYANLDMAERVKTAAAAAGAGNQQRMADQAAGNAMRNQAIAAGLQNRQFGLGVGDSSNRFLQTAMSLKYPPLGRFSTSQAQSTSASQQSDPPSSGGSKGGGAKPSGGGQKGGGGGGGQKGGGKGGGGGKPAKPGDQPAPARPKPGEGEGKKEGKGAPPPEEGKDPFGKDYDPTAGIPDERIPFETNYPEPEKDYSKEPPFEINYPEDTTPKDYSTEPPLEVGYPEPDPFGPDYDPTAGIPQGDYDPYATTPVGENVFGPDYDPTAGVPQEDPNQNVAEADPAGALFAAEPGGEWGGGDYLMPAGYEGAGFGGDEWSDIGQGAADQGAFDSAYDDFTDYGDQGYGVDTGGFDSAYDDFADYGDQGYGVDTGGYDDFTDYGNAGDYGTDDDGGGYDLGDTGGYDDFTDYGGGDEYDDFTDYGDAGDYGDDSYYDDFTDYGDAGDYGDDSYYDDFTDYGDAGDYGDDYYDDFADYGDESEYGDDYGDDSYDDYYNDDYSYDDDYYGDESGYGYDDSDYSYDDGGDYGYDDGGGDYGYDDGGYDDYARGGPVKPARGRQKMPRLMRRPMRTGFRPRPRRLRRRVPGMAQGGPMPPMGRGGRGGPGGPNDRLSPRTPPPTGRGDPMPGNFISANGMQPPATGGMPAPGPQTRMPRAAPQIRPARPRPQHFAGGGQAGQRPEPTQGGFVSRELSPSAGSKVDDVNARLNAGEFVIPKDVAQWKGKEFFYKMIASARKLRAGGDNEKPKVGYQQGGAFNPMQGGRPMMNYQTPAQMPQMPQMPQRPMARGMRR